MIHKISCAEVKTVYTDLLDGLGYYCNYPGESPFICLDDALLSGSDINQQTIHQVLLEYHRSIPADSIYRSFVILKYYEDLVPAPVLVPVPEPEIIVIGRAILHRTFTFYEFIHPAPEARIIG